MVIALSNEGMCRRRGAAAAAAAVADLGPGLGLPRKLLNREGAIDGGTVTVQYV